eukprot:Hpha_TRINITY_DN34898_c0_g1::TRINITY_DN34898_c0_g1_i1::g.167817::m.167817
MGSLCCRPELDPVDTAWLREHPMLSTPKAVDFATAATFPFSDASSGSAGRAHALHARDAVQAHLDRHRRRARRRQALGNMRPPRFDGDSHDVVLFLTRSVNLNLVAYKVKWEDEGRHILHPTDPLDVYWLSIDPAYRAKRAKSGNYSDRVELNRLERSTFGASVERLEDDAVHGRTYRVSSQVTKRQMLLYYHTQLKRPVLVTQIKGYDGHSKPSILGCIHAIVVWSLTGWKVLAMDLYGETITDGIEVSERVKGPGLPGHAPAGVPSDSPIDPPYPFSSPPASPARSRPGSQASPSTPVPLSVPLGQTPQPRPRMGPLSLPPCAALQAQEAEPREQE